MGLAEMGYVDVPVKIIESSTSGRQPWSVTVRKGSVPTAVYYQAGRAVLRDRPHACFGCWITISGDLERHKSCIDGHCSTPPEGRKPPRELLVSRA